jgi:carbon monoxide dehydrogenase subunit G
MMSIEESILIQRPIEDVFAFISETANLPLWQNDVLEARHTPAGPVQVGTQMTLVRVLMGRKLEATAVISEYAPPTRYGYQSTAGYAVAGVNTCKATADGTKVTARFDLQTGGLFPLAESVVARTIRRGVQSNLATLKDVLESQVATAP